MCFLNQARFRSGKQWTLSDSTSTEQFGKWLFCYSKRLGGKCPGDRNGGVFHLQAGVCIREFSSIDFEEYLHLQVPELLDSYAIGSEIKIGIVAREFRISLDAAILCALIINQLITSSLSHAFPQGQPGRIGLQMGRRPDGSVRVVVPDNGVDMPSNQDMSIAPKTLGLRLVTDLAK